MRFANIMKKELEEAMMAEIGIISYIPLYPIYPLIVGIGSERGNFKEAFQKIKYRHIAANSVLLEAGLMSLVFDAENPAIYAIPLLIRTLEYGLGKMYGKIANRFENE